MSYYDTEGRYTELQNLTISINNNALTTGVISDQQKITVFFDDPNHTDLQTLNVYKFNNVKNIILLLTGVKGDMKFIMGLLTEFCQSWNISYQDVASAAYISNSVADFIHSYTLRKNLRPLGAIILIADTITGDVYKVGVDSAYEKQNIFVVGRQGKKIQTKLKQISHIDDENIRVMLEQCGLSAINIKIFNFRRTKYSDWKLQLV